MERSPFNPVMFCCHRQPYLAATRRQAELNIYLSRARLISRTKFGYIIHGEDCVFIQCHNATGNTHTVRALRRALYVSVRFFDYREKFAGFRAWRFIFGSQVSLRFTLDGFKFYQAQLFVEFVQKRRSANLPRFIPVDRLLQSPGH